MSKPPIHRRKFLVDPDLQVGLSTEMVGWILVYFLVFSTVANLPNFVALARSPADDVEYLAAMEQLRGFAAYVVLPMAVTFVAMSIHGVFLTHRIAGPVVRLKRAMRELSSRRLPAPISLRAKDHFKDLADEVNAAVAVLREDSGRRRRMADDSVAKLRAVVRLLENQPADLRPALAAAHEALDAAEGLSSHLAVTTDASAPADADDAHPVPLADADLPAVVSEDLDALDPEPARSGDA